MNKILMNLLHMLEHLKYSVRYAAVVGWLVGWLYANSDTKFTCILFIFFSVWLMTFVKVVL